MFLGIQQIKAYEPGDADWGVKLDDVRGQAEAKQEITRVVSLWQSGEEFEKAGGKRERGVLFLGAPGTGKTMLSKAIATSFNCPFVTIPGSGFAQTFIGMDAVIVRFLARKAKKMAAKWGGQCIVFIDEIDAVGMRRQSLGRGFQPLETRHDPRHALLRPPGRADRHRRPVLETAAWREKLFAMRAEPAARLPGVLRQGRDAVRNFMIPGGMGGMGGGARAQPAAGRDGRHRRAAAAQARSARASSTRSWTRSTSSRARVRQAQLRLKPPQAAQGAGLLHRRLQRAAARRSTRRSRARAGWAATSTSARPRGRTGATSSTSTSARSRTRPTWTRRSARDELARITNGYSPAMIDQACSLALTYAHSDGRHEFSRTDLLEAMTTVESGVAIGQPYPKHEERATAIHEAGHAVCGHVYMENRLSTRLSIRKRGSAAATTRRWRSRTASGLALRGGRRPDLGLGAMAAEHVFYGQNTTGVGGDIGMVTASAARMVGRRAMAPGADRPLRPDRRPRGARGGRGEGHGALREARHARSCTARRRHDGRRPVGAR